MVEAHGFGSRSLTIAEMINTELAGHANNWGDKVMDDHSKQQLQNRLTVKLQLTDIVIPPLLC